MSTLYNRSVLKTWFEKGDRPTQGQFGSLIDSIFNLTDDLSLLSLIKSYDPTAVYNVGSIVIYQEGFWISVIANATGSFNHNSWNPLPGNSLRYLPYSPLWGTGNSYTVGDFVTNLGNVYVCNANNTSSTANTPPNTSFWTLTNIFSNDVQNWQSGVWVQNDVVFYNRSFYKLVSTIFNSVDLPAEVIAGHWKFVSQPASWSASTQYVVNEFVWVGTVFYRCLVNHTSTSSFANDLTAGDWLAYNVNLPISLDLSSSIVSNTGPWVFTLSPVPNAILGLYVNGQFQKNGYDYTQTGTNNEIITWVSPDFDLEIGDELIIMYQ